MHDYNWNYEEYLNSAIITELRNPKGLEINNSLELAHRFRADLVDPIEQNRKRSCTTLRFLRLRIDQRWSEAGMQKR